MVVLVRIFSLQIRLARALLLPPFGILLAPFLDMRKFVATALLFSLTVRPFVALAQNTYSEVARNQQRAGQVADRFMEQFRHTLISELRGDRFACRIHPAPTEPTAICVREIMIG